MRGFGRGAYPTTYWQAAGLLFRSRRQSLRLNDDLTLRFTDEGVAVDYHRLRLVLFQEDALHVTVRVAGTRGVLRPRAVQYLSLFLPGGCDAGVEGGVLALRFSGGRTQCGNAQTFAFLPTAGR